MKADLDPALEQVTEKIIGAAFEVSNTLGHGFLETIYQKALCHELKLRNIRFDEQYAFQVFYKGESVGSYRADLVVEDKVVVELKVAESLTSSHIGQVLNYLKAGNMRIGLLFNFAKPKVEFRRVIL